MNSKIIPTMPGATFRQFGLVGLDWLEIVERLGFKANVPDDECKVRMSWGFEVEGREGAIWDWKGSSFDKAWSAWGPREVFVELFGEEHVK